MRVSVIGLGNIGRGVAANLVRAGHDVVVTDLDVRRVEAVIRLGAIRAADAADAAARTEIVFSSLPGPAQVRHVGAGSDDGVGILSVMAPGSIWVELSTSDLATAHDLESAASLRGVGFLDAPVSGGPEGAATASLSLFVGGADDDVERVRPLFDAIASRIEHLGPVGSGTVAKIAQVTLCYTQTVALTEALLLGVKGGLDPTTMLDLIRHSAGASYVADSYGPEILAGSYDASFPIAHAAKDLRLAMALAESVGAELPFMRDVAALYAETEATYGPDVGHLVAAQLLERRNRTILHEHGRPDAGPTPGGHQP